MLNIPVKRKLNATKTTMLRPANAGFHIRKKEAMAPKIPKINKTPQFLPPYFLMSNAKLIDDIERKRSRKPT
jgi:hypothetical protein